MVENRQRRNREKGGKLGDILISTKLLMENCLKKDLEFLEIGGKMDDGVLIIFKAVKYFLWHCNIRNKFVKTREQEK